MKAAIYIRVSTDKAEQAQSLTNQKHQAIQFLKDRNISLYDFYTDVESGTTDKREALKQLISDAEDNHFNVIVTKELSRLARNGELSYKIKRIAENNGIHIITMDGVIDTTDPRKSGMYGLYAWIYEQESQRISDRIKAVYKTKYRKGKYLGSIPPYGYTVKDGKLFKRNDGTVEVVNFIFNSFLNGDAYTKIAYNLNQEGYATPATIAGKSNAGKIWYDSSIKKILSNPHYVGDIVQGRETSISVTNKRRQSLPQSEWVIVTDTHEPIINREDFERIQELIKAKEAKGKGKIRKQKHMFSGLIFCADCGKAMHRRRISGNSYYSCGSYVRGGSKYCSSHTIKEDNLKQAIIDDINSMVTNINSGDIYNRLERKAAKLQAENTKKLQSLENEIKKLIERKGGLIDLLADGVIDKVAYQERVKVTEEKLRSLEIKKYELKKDLDIDTNTNKLNLLKKELNKFVNFEDLSREMLHRLIERIEICADRATVKVYYRFARTA